MLKNGYLLYIKKVQKTGNKSKSKRIITKLYVELER